MAIYQLDVEKKYGQFHFRLFPKAEKAGEFGGPSSDVRALIAALEEALEDLDIKPGGDTVFFRNIEYTDATSLRETVRFSKY